MTETMETSITETTTGGGEGMSNLNDEGTQNVEGIESADAVDAAAPIDAGVPIVAPGGEGGALIAPPPPPPDVQMDAPAPAEVDPPALSVMDAPVDAAPAPMDVDPQTAQQESLLKSGGHSDTNTDDSVPSDEPPNPVDATVPPTAVDDAAMDAVEVDAAVEAAVAQAVLMEEEQPARKKMKLSAKERNKYKGMRIRQCLCGRPECLPRLKGWIDLGDSKRQGFKELPRQSSKTTPIGKCV